MHREVDKRSCSDLSLYSNGISNLDSHKLKAN